MIETLVVVTLVVAAISLVLLLVLLTRERNVRSEAEAGARAAREELSASVDRMNQSVVAQMTSIATVQNGQIDGFSRQLVELSGSNERRFDALRLTVEQQLEKLQQDNASKLELIRATVDEKLHATLEQRLSASFKQVSERLEQVHKGLGEMQTLAAGVGDLKRVLTNVKTRGTWGEVQLGALLEQMMTPAQYQKNVATRPGSNDRVEFALRLPGPESGGPVWLPIDAKFPLEDFQRLQEAQDAADPVAVEAASKALEARIRLEAKTIREKYIEPPATTDFALLYLPVESLYAEALRRPGLSEALQRDYKVMMAGPTTLLATLNSLQMGFRTLALEQRSAEVWEVLGAVKTEFSKFGDVLARTKKKLEEAGHSIEQAEVRTRAMVRQLRSVEALPESRSAELLPGLVAGTEADPQDG